MVNVTKLYPTEDATVFQSFGRVVCGTCKYCVIRRCDISTLRTYV